MKKIVAYLGQSPVLESLKLINIIRKDNSRDRSEVVLGLSNGSMKKYSQEDIDLLIKQIELKELEPSVLELLKPKVVEDMQQHESSFGAIGALYDVFNNNPEKPIERQPFIFEDVMVIASGHLSSCISIKNFLESHSYRPKNSSSAELIAMLTHYYRIKYSIRLATEKFIEEHLEDVKSFSFIAIDGREQAMVAFRTGNQELFFKGDRKSLVISSVNIVDAGLELLPPDIPKVFWKCSNNHLVVEAR